MNTIAKYIPSPFHAEGNKKKKPKKKIIIHNDISTDETPKKFILSKSVIDSMNRVKCSNITYPIENILITDPTLIQKTKSTRIFLCIYRIKNCNHKEQFPYIEYLLYKYPPNMKPKKLTNHFSFPFVMSKKNEMPFATANDFFYKITDGIYGKEKPQGFLERNDNLYFFYKANNKSHIAAAIEYYNTTQELWWVLIDEICNHQKVINFPIHSNVTNLFYQNPTLIYLRNAEKKRLEIPSVGYIGGPWTSLPAIARSVDPNTPNIERFFGSFVYAVRYGGWTDNFKSLTVDGEEIANKKGEYIQGGIVRFAIFLNKPYVVGVTDKDLEKYIENPDDWRNNFKSLFIGKIKFKNKIHSENSHFKVETFAQQVPLSYHRLDMNTLKKWNPQSTKYHIE